MALRIGFLGSGKMAQALAKGFIASGITKSDLIVGSAPPVDKHILGDFQNLGCSITHSNTEVVQRSEVVLISVKPPIVPKVLDEVNSVVSTSALFISIAMGIPIRNLEQMMPRGARLVRVMPNTPCLVCAGASVFSRGTHTTEEDAKLTKTLFESVGICEEVPETLLDVVTGMSGGGPAYMYIAIEALADGAVRYGIPRDMAYRLAAQTTLGAAKMVLETGKHPGTLKDDVCSPAGSTIQAVYFLERSGLRATLMEAVEAATLKSRQTGKKE